MQRSELLRISERSGNASVSCLAGASAAELIPATRLEGREGRGSDWPPISRHAEPESPGIYRRARLSGAFIGGEMRLPGKGWRGLGPPPRRPGRGGMWQAVCGMRGELSLNTVKCPALVGELDRLCERTSNQLIGTIHPGARRFTHSPSRLAAVLSFKLLHGSSVHPRSLPAGHELRGCPLGLPHSGLSRKTSLVKQQCGKDRRQTCEPRAHRGRTDFHGLTEFSPSWL